MKKYLFLLFIGLNLAQAQIYAPDTTFRFQNAKFDIPAYRFHTIFASDANYTLAYIEQPSQEGSINTPSFAVLDRFGKILDNLYQVWVIPNSFTENGFWFTYSAASNNNPRFTIQYYDLKTLKITPQYFNIPGSTRGILKIENNCLIMDGDIYYTFDLNGQLLSTINIATLNPTNIDYKQYFIQDVRVDKEKNTWVLVVRELSVADAYLQLYKLKPGESLDRENLVFEKTRSELGTIIGSIWQQSAFSGDTIIFKTSKDFYKPRELIKVDFNGNVLPTKTLLPLIGNNPNTNYEFVKSSKTQYLTLRIGQKQFYFINPNGQMSHLDLSNIDFLSLLIENDKVSYVDYLYKLHEIEIKTLKEVENGKKIPVISYEAGMRYLQSLNNNDFWVGSKNPFDNNTNYFVKFHQGKESYRYRKEVTQVFYSGKNDLILQAGDKEKILVDGLNHETYLSQIEGEIVYVDTLHKHIYTNIDQGKVYRYFYNQVKDSSFNWNAGLIKSEMIVTEDKKIFYNGNRFNFKGEVDNTFEPIKLINNSVGALAPYKLKRIWNSLFFLDASCGEGCWGNVYQWEKSENHPNLLSDSPNTYIYKYLNIVKRDSLLLDGFQKIQPNLKVDSTFIVKGRVSVANNWYSTPSNKIKAIDILPNHDLLGIYKNQVYRFSTKNNLWVEIRNLPNEIILSDSLIKSGLLLDVFSSDNSDVSIQLKSSAEKVTHLEGQKLIFDGNEGIVTLMAQSVNGGQPVEFIFWVRNPGLKQSTIRVSPGDTTLFTNFKPFPVAYTANINIPLKITVEGAGGYLKDGIIYPTGVAGYIHVRVSHGFIPTHYANQKEVLYIVNPLILSLEPENMLFSTTTVFPNPFKDYFNILSSDNDNIKDICLFDLNGSKIMDLEIDKSVYSPTMSPGFTSNKKVVNLKTSHIPNGYYLLVFTVNGKREARRIVK